MLQSYIACSCSTQDDPVTVKDRLTMASGSSLSSVPVTANTEACTVCLGALRDPRLLPCLHSFCCSCIEGLALSAKPARCPLCRCEFTCPKNGAAALARSCFQSKQRSGGGEDRVFCGQCDESWLEAAELWCVDCQIGLCKDHGGLHRKTRGCREHTVTALATRDVGAIASRRAAPSRSAARCAKHGELLKIYCVPCGEIICCECALRDHPATGSLSGVLHTCEFIDKLGSRYVKEIADLSNGLAGEVESMTSSLEAAEKALDTCESSAKKTRGAVKALFRCAIQVLVDEEKKLLDQVDELEDAQHKQLDQHREEAEARLGEVTTALQVSARVQDSCTDHFSKDWLDTAAVVRSRLNHLRLSSCAKLTRSVAQQPPRSSVITLEEHRSLIDALTPGERSHGASNRFVSVRLAGQACPRHSTIEEDGRALTFSYMYSKKQIISIVGQPKTLKLVTKDGDGVRLPCGGTIVKASLTTDSELAPTQSEEKYEVTVTDLDDGTYRLAFTLPANTGYKLDVSINGQAMETSMLRVLAVPWKLEPAPGPAAGYLSSVMHVSAESHNTLTAERPGHNGGVQGHMPLVSSVGMVTGRHCWVVTGAYAVGVTTRSAKEMSQYITLPAKGIWCWSVYSTRRYENGTEVESAISLGGNRTTPKTLVLSRKKRTLTLSFNEGDCEVSESITDLPQEELFAFFTLYTQGNSMKVCFPRMAKSRRSAAVADCS